MALAPSKGFSYLILPCYWENTELIHPSNKCKVLKERGEWQGTECRWATQMRNLSLAATTTKMESVITEIRQLLSAMDYSFQIQRIHETQSDSSSSIHNNSLQHWKYQLWDINSYGEVRPHPFHSFFSNWRSLDCFWYCHGCTVVVTFRMMCLFIICEF